MKVSNTFWLSSQCKPDILGILPTLVSFCGTVAGALAIDFLAVRLVGLVTGGCMSGCLGALSSFLLSFCFSGDLAVWVAGLPFTISPKTATVSSWECCCKYKLVFSELHYNMYIYTSKTELVILIVIIICSLNSEEKVNLRAIHLEWLKTETSKSHETHFP